MRIEPDLVPPADEEDWISSEFPAGGARVVPLEEGKAAQVEAAGQAEAGEPATLLQPAASPLGEANFPAGNDAANEPAPERQWPQSPPVFPDAVQRQEAEVPVAESGDDAQEDDNAQEGADDATLEERALIVLHVLAPDGQRFAGDALLAALRAVGLKYGDMKIFHRLKPRSQQAVFSVANAVEPGYFDLAGDCTSPGVTAFLELTGAEQDFEALDDLIHTTQAIADALGGALQDEERQPFTTSTLERYRGRVASFAQQQASE